MPPKLFFIKVCCYITVEKYIMRFSHFPLPFTPDAKLNNFLYIIFTLYFILRELSRRSFLQEGAFKVLVNKDITEVDSDRTLLVN